MSKKFSGSSWSIFEDQRANDLREQQSLAPYERKSKEVTETSLSSVEVAPLLLLLSY